MHETPVFMRLRRTLPMVTMRLSAGKVKGKARFSTVFLGILLNWPRFACFCLDFTGFYPGFEAQSPMRQVA
jgi:hypothetical protein